MSILRSPDLLISPPLTGKTTLLGKLALDLFKATGRPARLVSADGNLGEDGDMGVAISKGAVEVCYLPYLDPFYPLEAIELVTKGWWPSAGKLTKPEQPVDVTGYFFEGLTVFSELILDALRVLRARGMNYGGPESSIKAFPITDNPRGPMIAGNSLTDYLIAKDQTLAAVYRSSHLPGKVIWTALEGRGEAEDKEGGQDRVRSVNIFGPAMEGASKKMDSLLRRFGNSFSLEVSPDGTRHLHTQTWFDKRNPGVPHLAGTRGLSTANIPAVYSGKGINPTLTQVYKDLANGGNK